MVLELFKTAWLLIPVYLYKIISQVIILGFQIQLKSLAEEMQSVSKGLEKVAQEIAMSENDGPDSAGFRKV